MYSSEIMSSPPKEHAGPEEGPELEEGIMDPINVLEAPNNATNDAPKITHESVAQAAASAEEPATKKKRVDGESSTTSSNKPRVRRVGSVVPVAPPQQLVPSPIKTTASGEIISKHDEKWDQMFQKLVAYKMAHNGSTMVPQCYHEDPRLGRWVHYQRGTNVALAILNIFGAESLRVLTSFSRLYGMRSIVRC